MYFKNFFVKNTYLSNLDNLNKYVYPSIHGVPKVNEITITLFLTNFINATEAKTVTVKDTGFQVKAFLLCYLLFAFSPYLKSKRFALKVIGNKSLNADYALKITLTNIGDINEFLFVFFIENGSNVSTSDKVLLPLKMTTGHYIVRTSQTFERLSSFFLSFLSSTNLKEVLLNITFKVDSKTRDISKAKPFFLKNLPLFWLF